MESEGNVCILGCHGAMDTDSLPIILFVDSAGLVYIKQKNNGPRAAFECVNVMREKEPSPATPVITPVWILEFNFVP
jgi:hypothetical protein